MTNANAAADFSLTFRYSNSECRPSFQLPSLMFILYLCGFLSLHSLGAAQSQHVSLNATCEPNSNRVDFATHKFMSDCEPRTYCNLLNNTCQLKGCRVDEYPFGYDRGEILPPLCPPGSFCPDAQSQCLPLWPVRHSCELARDGVSFSHTIQLDFSSFSSLITEASSHIEFLFESAMLSPTKLSPACSSWKLQRLCLPQHFLRVGDVFR